MDKNNKMSLNSFNEFNDEIDLRPAINIALRNKIFISSFSFLITSICAISSFFITPIYRGSFEINTSEKNTKANSGGMQSKDASLFSVIAVATDSTQLDVLSSPLVLKPVYEYLKQKNILEKNNGNYILYKDWRKKLTIAFKLKSKVLNVVNEDTDKERILSTLKATVKEYKRFSRRDQLKQLNNGIAYLEKQEQLLLEKSRKSRVEFNEFAIKNGLKKVEGMVSLGNPRFDPLTLAPNSLAKLKTNNLDIEKTQLSNNNQAELLENYETTYIELSSKLKPNSKTIKNLKQKIFNLKESLKRPNETLLKFRELSSIAKRDEAFATSISNALQFQYLEKAKQLYPWEMITDPEITNKTWPNKKIITLVSFLLSIFIGYLIAIFRENRNGTIYEFKDLQKKINLEFFGVFSKENSELFSQVISSKVNLKDNLSIKDIGIIDINKEFLEKGSKLQNDLIINSNLQETSFYKSKEISKYKNLVLIIEQGKFNRNFELTLNNFLIIYKERLKGWFYII